MAATTMVHIRVDEQMKRDASEALSAMGLSISDAVRLLLFRVVAEKALPFEVRVPNALTAKTLASSDQGEDLHPCEDADDMFRKLGI
jgi:DNA-damage-inducible protein J